jgi:hypothetical protein
MSVSDSKVKIRWVKTKEEMSPVSFKVFDALPVLGSGLEMILFSLDVGDPVLSQVWEHEAPKVSMQTYGREQMLD